MDRIRNEGPIPFRDFMEMCLYYPDLGYYTSSAEKIGVNGDYYTSSNVSPAFGAMVARQLEEMWNILGEPEFNVVECGAGTGSMCCDILNYLNKTPLAGSLCYHIVEKNHQTNNLNPDAFENEIKFHDTLGEVQGLTGCIISNELVDNLPVHLVEMRDDLMEVYVDYRNGFKEVFYPVGEELGSFLDELDIVVPAGHRMEICLDSICWLEEISRSMDKGFIITIDYGFTTSDYLNNRKKGTLMCYRRHAVSDDPYSHIGSQDITTFANFPALRHWGSKYGLEFSGLTSQAEFLLALGYLDFIDHQVIDGSIALEALKESIRAKKLLLSMGERYKVLIQRKNLSSSKLTGLKT